jgi:hypothetical protein
MLLIVLYLLFLFIFFLFVAPNKNEVKERFIDKSKKNKNLNKSESEKELNYGKGFIIPQPAYIPNTNTYDMLSYNIHKRIKESDAKNVHHLFNAVTNDNYYLFNNLDNVEAVEHIKNNKLPYINLHYNPKIDKSHIFSTKLPYLGYYKRKDVIMKPLEETKKMLKKTSKKAAKKKAKKEANKILKKLIKIEKEKTRKIRKN